MSGAITIHATDQNNVWGVIEAKDYPPGIGRSRTRDTPGDALKANWEGTLVTRPGPGSTNKFVKVRLMDLPGYGKASSTKSIGEVLNSRAFGGGKVISDYPHTCPVCGGRMLILYSSVEHEGGECPGPAPKAKDNFLKSLRRWP